MANARVVMSFWRSLILSGGFTPKYFEPLWQAVWRTLWAERVARAQLVALYAAVRLGGAPV